MQLPKVSFKTTVKEMKMNKFFVLGLVGISLLMSCGEPNEPEDLDISGGYKIVNKFPAAGYANDLIKKDNLLYLSIGEGGLLIVDVDDIHHPQVVSITTEEVRGYSSRIAMKDSVVYLAAGTFGVNVVNVSDPFMPEVTVSNLGVKPAISFDIFGNYLLTAVSELGFNVTDISFPAQPDIRSTSTANGYAKGLVAHDTTQLLVACGEMGLSIYKLSNFLQGYGDYSRIGWCDTPGYAESVVINEEESIAFMACGTAGLYILDYADTNNVHITGSYDGPGYAKFIKYKNDRIYMSAQLGGFQVYDVSSITSPKLIGIVETEYAMGFDMDDENIYLADEVEGIIIIPLPN